MTRIKSDTRIITRLAQNVRGKNLLSNFEKVLEATEELDKLFADTKFDDKEIKVSVDKLRESFILAKGALTDVKRI